MANQPQRQKSVPAVPTAPPAVYPEPEVRRWPHPIRCGPEPEPLDLPAALHYIHCSLSYQNQLLSEIRSLLEGLSSGEAVSSRGK